MKKMVPTAAAALILTVIAAPVSAQNKEHQQQAAELRMLQEQQQQLALAISQLADAIKSLNGRLDAVQETNRTLIADLAQTLKNVGNDASVARQQSQDTDTRVRTLADEIAALQASLAQLPALLQGGGNMAPPPTAGADPNATAGVTPGTQAPVTLPAPVPPAVIGQSPTRMLETARADYFAGQYTLAITGFNELVKQYPRTDAAAEAQFLIGESNSSLNRWSDAITAYSAVVQNYPQSTFVAEALYKRGIAQSRAGQPDAARASWEQVIREFPSSDAANLARQGLTRLSTTGTSGPAR